MTPILALIVIWPLRYFINFLKSHFDPNLISFWPQNFKIFYIKPDEILQIYPSNFKVFT